MGGLANLPFLVILAGVGAAAMYVPAAMAYTLDQHRVGQAFFYSGTLFLMLAVMVAIATAHRRPRDVVRRHLAQMLGAYLLLPPMLAVPFAQAVPDTSFANAWFEMVSAFTTTGATLYTVPGRLPDPVQLWRALAGWMGGFFILLTAAAILAPMNLGGFEVLSPQAAGRGIRAGRQITDVADPAERLWHHARVILPAYGGATVALWMALHLAGEGSLIALCHAMATVSTSGISPVQGLAGGSAGFPGEALVFLGLMLAVTRRFWPGAVLRAGAPPLWRDPEVRLAAGFVTAIPALLFLRHWIGAIEGAAPDDPASALEVLWGAVFTVLSFLTTTGFESQGWIDARIWSGLEAPGLLLLGLAIMGGGVATTAGGVRLLRVYALFEHGRRELEKLSYPSSVGGGGARLRHLREDGAWMAFIFFMLFALTLGAVNLALALAGLEFETALILSIAALTTTGPLAGVAAEAPVAWSGQGVAAQAVLAATMVIGRFETLALLALIAPGAWRR